MATYMRWLAITYLPTMALASGVVLPCGVDDNHMPFGIQVLGPPGNDRLIIEVARALEAALSKHTITQQPKPNLDRLSA
jgi:Asp-tRNA(Asn)/Glu-tRNA(Gln) amidotransferase A subunit family amidase